MFRNYIKIAFRSLWKNKLFTGINIVGLSIGIAAVLLLYRVVSYEWNFNTNFENYDRIVRVVSEDREDDGDPYTVGLPIPAMEELETTIPQFEKTARIRQLWNMITVPNPDGNNPIKKFALEKGDAFFTESSFLEIFDFPALSGDMKTALTKPNSIVLVKSWAEKCFDGWENALGKTILIDNVLPFTVTGVLEDLPERCDFTFPYLVSYKTLESQKSYFGYDSNWQSCSSNDQFYALLQNTEQLATAQENVSAVGKKHYINDAGIQERVHLLQPISELHFDENHQNSGDHVISKSRLRILGLIGLLILIMACFNFINLATAQASLRTKEVGVRKTLGGQRGQLIAQFMTETGMTVLTSVGLGIGLAALCTPLLKYISDVPDEVAFFTRPEVWGVAGIITVAVTLLAGLYPSFSLASFQPIEALKNKISNRHFAGANIRKSLVVLQFFIAQGLIIGVIITLLQLDYIRSKDLGFRQDLVYNFFFNSDEATIARQNSLKQKLQQLPNIESVSLSSDYPMSGNTSSTNFYFANNPEDEDFYLALKYADPDFQEAYGIELVAGKWMTPSDTMRELVVNEILLDKLGIATPEEIIGQHIRMGRRKMPIVGVMKDFHTHSLHRERLPLAMTTRKTKYWLASMKVKPNDIGSTTAAVQTVFNEVLPEQVFDAKFYNEEIAEMYEADDRLAATCWGFGLLAIFISCLGLFGLAAHAATQRTKEIGIRKVLGASVGSLVSMLSKDFLLLVVIALLVASPIAWYLMQQWLNEFVYRIDIQWWVFVLAGLAAVLVAFLTVSFQSVKAALANPIESLRNE